METIYCAKNKRRLKKKNKRNRQAKTEEKYQCKNGKHGQRKCIQVHGIEVINSHVQQRVNKEMSGMSNRANTNSNNK